MGRIIREVAVDPPVPPDYVVFRRADIKAFIEAAKANVARLEAELATERQRTAAPVIDITEPAEPRIASGKITTLPPWVDEPIDHSEPDPVSFFESLREPGAPLIAGAEQAYRLA